MMKYENPELLNSIKKSIKEVLKIEAAEEVSLLDIFEGKHIFFCRNQVIFVTVNSDKNKKAFTCDISHIIFLLKIPCNELDDFIIVPKANIDKEKESETFLKWLKSPAHFSKGTSIPFYGVIENL